MAVYVLDTDTLSLLHTAHPQVLAAVARHRKTDRVVLSTVSVEEQINGIFKRLRAARNPTETARASRMLAEGVELWADFYLCTMTEPATACFEALLKLNVGRMDLRIAAIALEANVAVVTRNLRDFGRVPGLTVVDWSV